MSRNKKVKCSCLLCEPLPGKRAHHVWGYDLDAVPKTHCLACDTPIGDEPYEEELALARFGLMQFVHKRCTRASAKRKVPSRGYLARRMAQ